MDGEELVLSREFLEQNYICISHYHWMDMFGGSDHKRIQSRAKVLDSLDNLKFLRPSEYLQTCEIANVVTDFYKIPPLQKDVVVKNRFYQIFNKISYKDKKELQKDDSFSTMVNDVLVKNEDKYLSRTFGESYKMAKTISRDRKMVYARDAHDVLKKRVAERIYLKLKELIPEAFILVTLVSGVKLPPVNEELEEMVYRMLQKKLPEFLLFFQDLQCMYADALSKKDPNSERFKRTRSDYHDFGHLHAAIVCDQFSCDSRNYRFIESLKGSYPRIYERTLRI